MASETCAKESTVNKTRWVCDVTDCLTQCMDCGVCPHVYSCSCTCFALTGVSCKHIHLVQRIQNEHNSDRQELASSQQLDLQNPSNLKLKLVKTLSSLMDAVKQANAENQDELVYLNNLLELAAVSFDSSEKKKDSMQAFNALKGDNGLIATHMRKLCGQDDLDLVAGRVEQCYDNVNNGKSSMPFSLYFRFS